MRSVMPVRTGVTPLPDRRSRERDGRAPGRNYRPIEATDGDHSTSFQHFRSIPARPAEQPDRFVFTGAVQAVRQTRRRMTFPVSVDAPVSDQGSVASQAGGGPARTGGRQERSPVRADRGPGRDHHPVLRLTDIPAENAGYIPISRIFGTWSDYSYGNAR
jgi:hypothetical protein